MFSSVWLKLSISYDILQFAGGDICMRAADVG